MKEKIISHQEICNECGRITKKQEVLAYCDHCDSELEHPHKTHMTVFLHDNTTENMRFCGWGCCLAWLVSQADKLFTDPNFYFVGFPHLMDTNVREFFEAGIPVTVKQLQFLNVRKE